MSLKIKLISDLQTHHASPCPVLHLRLHGQLGVRGLDAGLRRIVGQADRESQRLARQDGALPVQGEDHGQDQRQTHPRGRGM